MLMPPPKLPPDAALPQLAVAVDAAAIGRQFELLLRQHGAELLECRIDRIKYRPGRSVTVGYVLKLRCPDDALGAAGEIEQRVGARFCADGSAGARYAKAIRQPQQRPGRLPAYAQLAPVDGFVWFVPNDPKLASLRWLADGARLLRSLPPALDQQLEAGAPVASELVQYVPEARATARVTVGSGADAQVLYVKTDGEQRGGQTHALMQALAASAAQRSGRLLTPATVAWQPATGLHWQQGVAGTALHALAPLPPAGGAARLGAIMAALHGTPVALERRVDVAAVGTEAVAAAALLRMYRPAQSPALTLLLRELAKLDQDLAGAPAATLHGDLHTCNVLVDGDRWTIIDWDSARRGPALLELGAVCAELLYCALMLDRPAAAAFAAIDALADSYRAHGGLRCTEGALARATAHNLLTQRAYRCLANLKPGRLALVPALVELAAAIASRGRLVLPAESLS